MPPTQDIVQLLVKKFREELDEVDNEKFETWLKADSEHQTLVAELGDSNILAQKLKEFREADPETGWRQFLAKTGTEEYWLAREDRTREEKAAEFRVGRERGDKESEDQERKDLERNDPERNDPERKDPERKEKTAVPLIRRRRVWVYAAAAAVILLLAVGANYWLHSKTGFSSLAKTQTGKGGKAVEDAGMNPAETAKAIEPGGNKAKLTLADGRSIDLDKTSGLIAGADGITIKNDAQGELAYTRNPLAKNTGANTLTTPAGGQYMVALTDGTKIKLNAGSALQYPTVFDTKQRVVILKGEAYFDVAPMKGSPFIVSCESAESTTQKEHTVKGLQVEALGTRFVVSAYEDDKTKKTVLFQGSVKVSLGEKHVLLKPGFQAVLGNNAAAGIQVEKAPEETESWMEGFFNLDGQDLPLILRQLSRWYNVEIKTEGNLPDMKFAGALSRNWPIGKLMNALALQGEGKFTYRIGNRVIFVTGQPQR